MKNKFFSVIILCISAFACLLLSSCNANNGNASNDESTFAIAASSDIYYLGDEAITLTVDGELPYGYSEKDISYIIENSDESATCTISQDGTLTFGGIGMATVRAKVGETLSKNAVNVYALNTNEIVGENISAAFDEPLFLGKKVNVGIHPSCAHLYSADNAEGFITINENGELEFCGLRTVQSHTKLLCRDTAIYEGMYAMPDTISTEILESLEADGVIEDNFTDVSRGMLASISHLAITNAVVGSIEKYAFLSYCTSLEELDLSGSTLFDLSFVSKVPTLKTLIIDNCRTIDNNDGSLTLHNSLISLSSLELLSISGAFSCFDRESYDMLSSMVKRGNFKLRVLDDTIVDSKDIYHFSETVFFSMAEYLAHINANKVFTPHDGFSHAILCFSGDDSFDVTSGYTFVKADPISILELYGDERNLGIYITSDKDLTLNLYDFRTNLFAKEQCSAINVTSGSLTLNAKRGVCSLTAGNATEIGTVSGPHWFKYAYSGAACISASGDVSLLAYDGAELYIAGGSGAIGPDGEADGSNPSDMLSLKHGGMGGEGGAGIYADNVSFLGGRITVYGGNGGKGGNGGDGSGVNILFGGYNAGDGGRGGYGGVAVNCLTYTLADANSTKLVGGMGGQGGDGGDGYLAGKNGSQGLPGETGVKIYKRND